MRKYQSFFFEQIEHAFQFKTTPHHNQTPLTIQQQFMKHIGKSEHWMVARKFEPMSTFLNIEQKNFYYLKNKKTNQVVGYIREKDNLSKGLNVLYRNLLRVRRSFVCHVEDTQGNVVIKMKRPFYWFASKIFITDAEGKELAEIHQRFHPFRRIYHLYIDKQQVAYVDENFFAWSFHLKNATHDNIATVSKHFINIPKEVFTDCNLYSLEFTPNMVQGDLEKQLLLASLISIDFDFFSNNSLGRGGKFFSRDGVTSFVRLVSKMSFAKRYLIILKKVMLSKLVLFWSTLVAFFGGIMQWINSKVQLLTSVTITEDTSKGGVASSAQQ